MMPDLYERKLRIGEIFSEGWRIYCRYFAYLVAFVLPCNFAAQMLLSAVPRAHKLLGVLVALFTTLITLIGSIVIIFITERASSAQPVSWGECRKKIFETYGRTVWTAIVLSVMLMLACLPFIFFMAGLLAKGFLSCISPPQLIFLVIIFLLPPIIVSIYLQFVFSAVVLRGKTAVSALCYSWNVVRNRWWYVFVAVIVLNLPVALVQGISLVMLRILGLQANSFIFGSFKLAISILTIYSTILITLLFLNLDRNAETTSSLPFEPEEKRDRDGASTT